MGQPRMPKSQWQGVLKNLRRINVNVHRKRECDLFAMLWRRKQTFHLDVLWLELFRCPEVNVNFHRRPNFPAAFVHNDVPEGLGPGQEHLPLVDSGCLRFCSYLSKGALWEARVRKVVVRGAQVMWDRLEREYQVPGGLGHEEMVLVVDSSGLWYRPPDTTLTCAHRRFDDHFAQREFNTGSEDELRNRLGESVCRWGFAPFDITTCCYTIRRMTIVFWSGSPDTPWTPPCGHFHGHPITGENEASSTCSAYTRMWFDLVEFAQQTALERMTIVNGDALAIPPGAPSDQTRIDPLSELRQRILGPFEGRAPVEPEVANSDYDAAQSDSEGGDLEPAESSDGESDYSQSQSDGGYGSDPGEWDGWTLGHKDNLDSGRPPQLLISSMAEWIESGEWEDVFSRKEIQPYLNAVRQERSFT
ncbi:hypothetical protein A1Q1_05599 [Trichosporon asahii var. asahii CBS 2479]|uniref:Uncharacterized protein n=1 Tax=Trichosporon asahii var. asahii (strain ATCC 90039 / CBS 2479 / JCM 2466 / KCTC 7840 / NBRC 103889/ NCYC 2677 / UAMH 7654) TaxID=1186058 RepID=J6ET43_TRIAS|nr:hypothetical protein A1Q1_05599 [Trichosporon asahii var. asahii CBS 2479]EJT45927.1 hypothetical protein A1Q1_05599 [Trichosporon asahii var. asahii CBS 2479]